MVEDLGLYSGTKPRPSCYDFSLDLLYLFTGLEHFPQGYFTGPGLVEMSHDSKIILIIDVYAVAFW
jgi:hypothetical protein